MSLTAAMAAATGLDNAQLDQLRGAGMQVLATATTFSNSFALYSCTEIEVVCRGEKSAREVGRWGGIKRTAGEETGAGGREE